MDTGSLWYYRKRVGGRSCSCRRYYGSESPATLYRYPDAPDLVRRSEGPNNKGNKGPSHITTTHKRDIRRPFWDYQQKQQNL